MLYINDPDAYRAIIDERRRGDGQHTSHDGTDQQPAAPVRRRRRGSVVRLPSRPAPVT